MCTEKPEKNVPLHTSIFNFFFFCSFIFLQIFYNECDSWEIRRARCTSMTPQRAVSLAGPNLQAVPLPPNQTPGGRRLVGRQDGLITLQTMALSFCMAEPRKSPEGQSPLAAFVQPGTDLVLGTRARSIRPGPQAFWSAGRSSLALCADLTRDVPMSRGPQWHRLEERPHVRGADKKPQALRAPNRSYATAPRAGSTLHCPLALASCLPRR